ncbi:MAG: Zinc ABC transporter, periplasmic-binding protein ZnuA [uncultured Sulfurovum sp.]|uniref:Zinc ABC transporter, periplasmic-binding protein ZnuA n=1 Tax=uncultured Sulfurovum sp. TaxID=269237 RepID=A0A6S6TUL0_9BACT|nr:MAG: Zinc ABC transporter, periplasmic-binding protein ZnuA [uncultured Sulfurovum sp.]
MTISIYFNMHKMILIYLLTTTYIFSNINAIVSIVPQKVFLEAIGGDKVNISLMVKPGSSPHAYEPKASQMVSIAKASLYFSIGVEFEDVWLAKFSSLNGNMKIIDTTKNIEKIPMTAHSHHQHAHNGHQCKVNHTTDDTVSSLDPHIWTTPKNVRIIAQNMFDALVKYDEKNREYYKNNLNDFLEHLKQTDHTITSLLRTLKKERSFMVFHPSWGYFAKEYHLEQIAVEVEGKSPKPRELVQLIYKARDKGVKAIFTQPEFSDTSAKIIASELNIPVVKITPMATNWSENLIQMVKVITGK